MSPLAPDPSQVTDDEGDGMVDLAGNEQPEIESIPPGFGSSSPAPHDNDPLYFHPDRLTMALFMSVGYQLSLLDSVWRPSPFEIARILGYAAGSSNIVSSDITNSDITRSGITGSGLRREPSKFLSSVLRNGHCASEAANTVASIDVDSITTEESPIDEGSEDDDDSMEAVAGSE